MQNAFATGDKGLRFLRSSIKSVFIKFGKKVSASQDHVFDLRYELMAIFESIVTLFIFGEDLSDVQIPMNKLNEDGTYEKVDLKLFAAMDMCMKCSIACFVYKASIGEVPIN